MITIEVDAKQATAYFTNLVKKAPKAMDFAARDMAIDWKKGARQRITTRRTKGETPSKGLLWKSIKATKLSNGKWRGWQDQSIAPYGPIVEHGITGWHFVPLSKQSINLAGRWGQGIARRGGRLPKGGGKHFAADAFISTTKRAKKITERHIKELVK